MPDNIADAFDELRKQYEAPSAATGGTGVMDGGDAPQPKQEGSPAPVSTRPDAKPAGRPAKEVDTSLVRDTSTAAAPAPGRKLTQEDFLQLIRGAQPPRATPEQRAGLPADTKATPSGLAGPSGAVKLNAAGQRHYQAAMARQRARYGDYMGKDDPKHPHPEFQPGRVEFNPFSGTWVEPDE